jgi:hypothetical protein
MTGSIATLLVGHIVFSHLFRPEPGLQQWPHDRNLRRQIRRGPYGVILSKGNVPISGITAERLPPRANRCLSPARPGQSRSHLVALPRDAHRSCWVQLPLRRVQVRRGLQRARVRFCPDLQQREEHEARQRPQRAGPDTTCNRTSLPFFV